ncbi:MAG: C40 family peptidase [Treponema sp.]|nr:C40 family peptidase [Treponema sp.]
MKNFQNARTLKKWLPLFLMTFLFSFSSCSIAFEIIDDFLYDEFYIPDGSSSGDTVSDDSDLPAGGCPAQLAATAFEYAKKYAAADTQYKFGAQDGLRAIQVDCSGLVVRCYRYALQDTDYSLLQNDMASLYMYQHATIPTTNPRRGDLVFMTYNNSKVSHVGIFDRFEGNQVYFIDAIDQGKGKCVTERHYARTDSKIVGYGIMKVK